jgi:antitoxin component HigA of HigAB toxin-antitoxin module
MDVKRLIKYFMEQYNLTNSDCAKILGIKTQSFYNKIYRGNISVKDLCKLLDGVGATIVFKKKT